MVRSIILLLVIFFAGAAFAAPDKGFVKTFEDTEPYIFGGNELLHEYLVLRSRAINLDTYDSIVSRSGGTGSESDMKKKEIVGLLLSENFLRSKHSVFAWRDAVYAGIDINLRREEASARLPISPLSLVPTNMNKSLEIYNATPLLLMAAKQYRQKIVIEITEQGDFWVAKVEEYGTDLSDLYFQSLGKEILANQQNGRVEQIQNGIGIMPTFLVKYPKMFQAQYVWNKTTGVMVGVSRDTYFSMGKLWDLFSKTVGDYAYSLSSYDGNNMEAFATHLYNLRLRERKPELVRYMGKQLDSRSIGVNICNAPSMRNSAFCSLSADDKLVFVKKIKTIDGAISLAKSIPLEAVKAGSESASGSRERKISWD